jgi:4-hydroxy-tetrahydrodipicolinate synthase
MPALGNLVTAMVTPFDDNLQVDYTRLAELAVRLADAGSDLLVSGTTGESPTTSVEEKLEMFRVVREAVGDDVPILAGTGSNDTAKSIALTKQATELGVLDAILLVGPYYSKPSQEGFYQHFRAVAQSTDLPVVLYNVPGRTGKNIECSTVVRLAEDVENIVGMKEASGDLDQIAEICRDVPAGFRVWSGDDAMTLPILAVGGVGVISVASHIAPEEIGEMIDCYHNGDVARAAEIHGRLLPLYHACFLASGNPPCVKRALEVCGFPVGGTRLPVVPASEKDTATIREVCEKLGYA